MKKNLSLFIILLFVNNCFGQETVKKKDRPIESIVEIFHVLKADKSTKQGLYQALYKNKIPLASGEYTGNKRAGIWHFYNTQGKLSENFNYDTNTLLYEAYDDSIAKTKIAYAFDANLADTDRITKPIKPGGETYGYIPYMRIFQLPDSLYNIEPARFMGIIELLISPGGRLADFKVHINDGYYDESETTFSPDIIDEDDRIFIPATLNKVPILSRIFIRCIINNYGELDLE